MNRTKRGCAWEVPLSLHGCAHQPTRYKEEQKEVNYLSIVLGSPGRRSWPLSSMDRWLTCKSLFFLSQSVPDGSWLDFACHEYCNLHGPVLLVELGIERPITTSTTSPSEVRGSWVSSETLHLFSSHFLVLGSREKDHASLNLRPSQRNPLEVPFTEQLTLVGIQMRACFIGDGTSHKFVLDLPLQLTRSVTDWTGHEGD